MRWRPFGFGAFVQSIVLSCVGAAVVLLLTAGALDRRGQTRRLHARLDRLGAGLASGTTCLGQLAAQPRPALGSPLLASWRSVAGCGASSASGGGPGVKWIGRSATGGLFGVQCQASYSPLLAERDNLEHHFVVNTLIARELTERISLGINLPFVYKYLRDPYQLDIDLSNGGLGDLSFQGTARLGAIGATAVTATVGLPTGKWNTRYRNSPLPQHQQLGFGKRTYALMADHTVDETWGLIVLGGQGSWRGGQNGWESYRAPSGSAYSYAGLYLGRFVPTVGLSTTGFLRHDRDRSQEENSALFMVAGNVSLEWSADWIALLAGASIPFQYDGVVKDSEGFPRNPWRWGQWVVGFGVSLSPF